MFVEKILLYGWYTAATDFPGSGRSVLRAPKNPADCGRFAFTLAFTLAFEIVH